MSRRRYQDWSVSYGAIGESQNELLLKHPPKGYHAYEMSLQIGSSRQRFEKAVNDLLSWRVQLRTGVTIDGVEEGAEDVYRGMGAHKDSRDEIEYTAEGWAYANPGATLTAHRMFRKRVVPMPLRVMFVTKKENVVTLGLGTLGGHPLDGEQLHKVEIREDDSVWYTIRGFVRPGIEATQNFGILFMPVFRTRVRRMLKALHPAAD